MDGRALGGEGAQPQRAQNFLFLLQRHEPVSDEVNHYQGGLKSRFERAPSGALLACFDQLFKQ